MQRQNQKTIDVKKVNNQKYLKIAASLVEILFKTKYQYYSKTSFSKIKQKSLRVTKKTNNFVMVINKTQKRKEREYKRAVLSKLLQIKIEDILVKRQKLKVLKANSKLKSFQIIFNLLNKTLKNRIKNSFKEFKFKALRSSNFHHLRLLKLTNTINTISKKLLFHSIKSIKFFSFQTLSKYKRLFVIQNVFMRKRCQNLSSALFNLRNQQITVKKEKKGQKLGEKQIKNQIQKKEEEILKQLQQKKKGLQNELRQKKNGNREKIKQKSDQISKFQEQFQDLKFSIELMSSQNEELKEGLKQRQRISQQRQKLSDQREKQRGEQGEGDVINKKKLNLMEEKQVWNGVLNNLYLYLYKLKKQNGGRSQGEIEIKVLDLLERISEPLMSPSTLYGDCKELSQQNMILQQLLSAYQAQFKMEGRAEIVNEGEQNTVNNDSFELSGQRKHLYKVTQCLSRWGSSETKELDQIKSILTRIKGQDNIKG